MSPLNFLSSLSLGFLLTAQHGFNYSPRLSSVPLMPDSAPLVAQASSLPPISKVEYHFCGFKGTGKREQGTVTRLEEDCTSPKPPFLDQEEASNPVLREQKNAVPCSPFPVPDS